MSGGVERVVVEVAEDAVDVARAVGKAAKEAGDTAKRTLAHDAATMADKEVELAAHVPHETLPGPGHHHDGSEMHLPASPPLRIRLDQAQSWKGGDLPAMGGPPNGYLVKRTADGSVTNYSVYDSIGNAIKRVDVTGASHGPYPTPHTMYYQHNRTPDGTVIPRRSRDVRPATPDEIP